LWYNKVAVPRPTTSSLTDFAAHYEMRPLDEVPVSPTPSVQALLDDDVGGIQAGELGYERAITDWAAVHCAGSPLAAPRRFVDGSIASRTVASFTVDGLPRPAVLATVGAMALTLEPSSRVLRREVGDMRCETVLCILSNGVSATSLDQLAEGLSPLGIGLVATESQDTDVDFEVLRRRCFDFAKRRMEAAERAVLLEDRDTPAAVDGLLERRLTTASSQRAPAYGVVKRQLRRYLPDSVMPVLYGLDAGERTPAFLLATEHGEFVSWYVRLTTNSFTARGIGVGPSHGIVRLSVARAYAEERFPDPAERFAEISAVSAVMVALRHRQRSYGRAAVSLEPIVRVEDELHAVMPDIAQTTARLHRALNL
jgi:hypothetical protein